MFSSKNNKVLKTQAGINFSLETADLFFADFKRFRLRISNFLLDIDVDIHPIVMQNNLLYK